MANRLEEDLREAKEGRSKAKHDRPQRPTIVRDEGSDDDDFVDTPRSRGVSGRGNIDEQEARSKAKNDRPQKPTGKKRKAKENVGDEAKGLAKKQKGKDIPGKASYPKLSTRTSPSSLVKSFEVMEEAQKNAVKELGFGHILRLTISDIPSRLAYWVVNNFDARSCQLILGTGTRITIKASDVYRVFGFPMGEITIDATSKNPKCDLLEEWTRLFGTGKPRICPKDIVHRMLEDKEGGVWFKCHFIILLVSSLIENSSSGYVTPNIMGYLDDVKKIKGMNWCKYTLDCLLANKKMWDKEKHKSFLGLALFLTLFFVDLVSLYEKRHERSFPICLNWNNDSLRARERDEIGAKGFGYGRHLQRIELISEQDDDVRENADTTDDVTEEDSYARKLYIHAKHVAEKMLQLMEMIEKTPVSTSDYFQKAMRTSQMLCTGGQVQGNQYSTEPTQFATSQADRFWGKEEVMKIIQEVEAANPKNNTGSSKTHDNPSRTTTTCPRWSDDMPSFSLGMTQELYGEVNVDTGNKDHDACEPATLKQQIIEDKGKKNSESVTLKQQTFENKGKKKSDSKCNRVKKKTAEFCSPYLNRAVKPTGQLTKTEREVAYYMMHSEGNHMEEVIFKHGEVELRRGEIRSLRPTMYVLAEVVSTWNIILNEKEKLRAPDSPFRFFATVTSTMNSITSALSTWDNTQCEEWFCDNLTHELAMTGAKQLGQFDMFVFPIYKTNHFYVVCINMKKSVMVVIDNANVAAKICLSFAKYRTTAIRLKSMFAHFLEKKGMNEMASKVEGVRNEILQLKWVEPNNTVDCAIYTMRHMETYMGENGTNWQHGLNPKLTKQMRYLRARYCVEIVTAACNEKRQQNIADAASSCLVLLKKTEKKIDLESEVIDWDLKSK